MAKVKQVAMQDYSHWLCPKQKTEARFKLCPACKKAGIEIGSTSCLCKKCTEIVKYDYNNNTELFLRVVNA